MAEESEQSGEKTEEPSAHRIEEFRKKGDVASSKELSNVIVLIVTILTLSLSLIYIFETLSNFIDYVMKLDYAKAFTEKEFSKLVSNAAVTLLKSVGPVLLATVCVGIFCSVAQTGFLFSPEILNFKPERINPVNGFKKLFSMKSIVEAVKGIFKFVIVLSIVYFFFKEEASSFSGFLHLDIIQSFTYGKSILVKLSYSILLGLVVVAIGDFAYQKFSYRKKIMMTKDEAKREMKEQEGSPEVKQKVKMIQREMAQKRMMEDVPNADVIVTNPTHISIAIQYDAQKMISPVVIGKGADHLALRIREIAKEHDIPIVENVPLARTMYKTVKSGDVVPRSLYKAVAEVLAFVYKLKRKKKALS